MRVTLRDGTNINRKRSRPPIPPMPSRRRAEVGKVNLANGTYNALQSGYMVEIEVSPGRWTEPIRLNTGIRGTQCRCTAIVTDGEVFIKM